VTGWLTLKLEGCEESKVALTTTDQEIISQTIDIPSWAGLVSIDAQARLQITNGSGVQGAVANVRFNDVLSGAATDDVPNGSIGGAVKREVFQLSMPGATVEGSAYGRVTVGTNSANATTLHIVALGVR
jgi:hypothetical protein